MVWYSTGDDNPFDAGVFYVYPTVTMMSFAENVSSWLADIKQAEISEMANELLIRGFMRAILRKICVRGWGLENSFLFL